MHQIRKQLTGKEATSTKIWLSLVVLVLSAAVLQFVQVSQLAGAQSAADLQAETEQLERQIAENEGILDELGTEIDTLEGKLTQLDTEITIASDRLSLTNKTIRQLQDELVRTEAELERQQGILDDTLVALYVEGDVSTLELVFASDNFGEYFQEQQYLESLKVSVQDSADSVAVLKDEIAAEKAKQEELQQRQEADKAILDSKRNEQSDLLSRTRGQEDEYQKIVTDLEAALIQAQEELEDLLASQNFVSLGSVKAGDTIGYVGSTGYSTGPHLHFAVYNNGSFSNPYAGGGSMNFGMIWPLPTVGTSSITQLFGCQSQIVYLTACAGGGWLHAGLDVGAWYGEPVVAAADGDIVFRGWSGGYGNAVIIDHGGGVQSYYAHLNE